MTAKEMRKKLAEEFYTIAMAHDEDAEIRCHAADVALNAMLDVEGRTRHPLEQQSAQP